MNIIEGNILHPLNNAQAICITTNGTTRSDHACVMGRGNALAAKTKWPGIEYDLGNLIRKNGNHVQIIRHVTTDDYYEVALVAFPVKNHWKEQADINLIVRSCLQLVSLANKMEWNSVWLAAPGVGNGRLSWSEVEKVLAPRLDNRFSIVFLPKNVQ